jgi:hypothetical protein
VPLDRPAEPVTYASGDVSPCRATLEVRVDPGSRRWSTMSYLPWISAALMLLAAVMLVLSSGPVGLWIAVVTGGVAILAVDSARNTHHRPHV